MAIVKKAIATQISATKYLTSVNTSLIFKKKKNGFISFFLKTTFPTFLKNIKLLFQIKKISFYFYSQKSVYDLGKTRKF